MNDHVPSIFEQGNVYRVNSPIRAYNSGMALWHGMGMRLCSRTYNEDAGRSELVWQRGGFQPWRFKLGDALNFPGDRGWENYEDGRLFQHNGGDYVAYTLGDYRVKPFVSTQMISRLDADLQPCSPVKIRFGGNGMRSEKNWQFFSRENRLHFVYSIQPHIVVELDERFAPTRNWNTVMHPFHWSWGMMRGGSPPLRVDGGRYLSFFHSFTKHPNRQRRYTMSAYTFQDEPPFRILEISPPLLRASGNDEQTKHPGHPEWKPIVVFPCGAAFVNSGTVIVSLGVNDSFDAIATFPGDDLERLLEPVKFYSEPRNRKFWTPNASLPVMAGGQIIPWRPTRGLPGSVPAGEMETCNPDVIEALEGRRGVKEIQA